MTISVSNPYFTAAGQYLFTPLNIAVAVSVLAHLGVLLSLSDNGFETNHNTSLNPGQTLSVRISPAGYRSRETVISKQASNKSTAKLVHSSYPGKKNINPAIKKIPAVETKSTKQADDSNEPKDSDLDRFDFSRQEGEQGVRQENDHVPTLVFSLPPEYPAEARWESRTGSTVLRYRVTRQGKVSDVNIVHSSGHQDLDWAAIEAIRQWRYKQDDINPQAWRKYAFHFKLQ